MLASRLRNARLAMAASTLYDRLSAPGARDRNKCEGLGPRRGLTDIQTIIEFEDGLGQEFTGFYKRRNELSPFEARSA